MTYSAVIFDLFGTLVEDFAAATGSTSTDLASVLRVPREPFMRVWRETAYLRIDGTFQTVETSITHVCDAIGVRPADEQIAEAVELRLDQIRRALKPKPDAAVTLARLKEFGYKLGLLSNCSIEIPILWPETPLAKFFDAVVFSSRERLKKPDPQIFRLACERLDVAPEECVYIADGENYELAAAASVGLHPVLIRNPTSQKRATLFREAEEWQGITIQAVPEVLRLVQS